MTRHHMAAVIAFVMLATSVTGAFAASNVIHYEFVEFEESTMELSAELAACVGYSGTLSEERTYDIQVIEFVRGPRAGDVHLNGWVTGPITIAPDDPADGPVYSGDMREKIVFRGTSFDDPLGFTFVVHASLTGPDGSRVKILYHGHGVFDRDGEMRAYFDRLRCVS